MPTSVDRPPANGELRRQYLEEGFCVLKGFLPLAQVQQIYDDMMSIFAHQLRRLGLPEADWRTPSGLSANLVTLFRTDMETYLNCARQTQLLPSIHTLTACPEFVDVLKSLGLDEPIISTKPVCHYMTGAIKVPGGYNFTPPHQDWRSMQGSLDGAVIWVPLVDIDTDSYPVEAVPGSHKLGLLDTEPHAAIPAVSDPRIRDEDYIPLLVERGDVGVFNGFLVHRTSERGDDRVRVAMSLRYNNAAEPSYVAHGYATPYKYGYQLELLFENFPTEQQIHRIFSNPAS